MFKVGRSEDVRNLPDLAGSQREKSPPPLLRLFGSLEEAIDLQSGAFQIHSSLLLLRASPGLVFKEALQPEIDSLLLHV